MEGPGSVEVDGTVTSHPIRLCITRIWACVQSSCLLSKLVGDDSLWREIMADSLVCVATTPKKSPSAVQHDSEFVVGKVADKTALQQLYAPIEPPTPPKSKTKGGKGMRLMSPTCCH